MKFLPFYIFGSNIRAGILNGDVRGGVGFPVQTANQVHGIDIVEVDDVAPKIMDGDVLVCSKKNIAIMVKTADCIPLVLADENAGIIAAVHAGWRGLVKGVVSVAVKKMCKMGASPQQIKVGIGPSLGLCCSAFDDPENEIPNKYHFAIDGKMVDLNGICDFQLKKAGILEANVERVNICTCHNPEWFSWRRDHDERRFGTFIELLNGKYYISLEIKEEISISL